MIRINFLPLEMRKAAKKLLPKKSILSMEVIIGSIAAFAVIVILLHVALMVMNVKRLTKYKVVKAEWDSMQPEKRKVDKVLGELNRYREQKKEVKDFQVGTLKIWAPVLNMISDQIPRGVWLSRLTIEEEKILLQGSAIERDTPAVVSVHNFVNNLEEASDGMRMFQSFEMESVQNRTLNQIKLAEFLIQGLIGEREGEKAEKQEETSSNRNEIAERIGLPSGMPLPPGF